MNQNKLFPIHSYSKGHLWDGMAIKAFTQAYTQSYTRRICCLNDASEGDSFNRETSLEVAEFTH